MISITLDHHYWRSQSWVTAEQQHHELQHSADSKSAAHHTAQVQVALNIGCPLVVSVRCAMTTLSRLRHWYLFRNVHPNISQRRRARHLTAVEVGPAAHPHR